MFLVLKWENLKYCRRFSPFWMLWYSCFWCDVWSVFVYSWLRFVILFVQKKKSVFMWRICARVCNRVIDNFSVQCFAELRLNIWLLSDEEAMAYGPAPFSEIGMRARGESFKRLLQNFRYLILIASICALPSVLILGYSWGLVVYKCSFS